MHVHVHCSIPSLANLELTPIMRKVNACMVSQQLILLIVLSTLKLGINILICI